MGFSWQVDLEYSEAIYGLKAQEAQSILQKSFWVGVGHDDPECLTVHSYSAAHLVTFFDYYQNSQL